MVPYYGDSVSVLYDGSKFLSHGISLLGGTTKSIVEGPTKFLGKLIDVSVHSTKVAAGKAMVDRFTTLLGTVDKNNRKCGFIGITFFLLFVFILQ